MISWSGNGSLFRTYPTPSCRRRGLCPGGARMASLPTGWRRRSSRSWLISFFDRLRFIPLTNRIFLISHKFDPFKKQERRQFKIEPWSFFRGDSASGRWRRGLRPARWCLISALHTLVRLRRRAGARLVPSICGWLMTILRHGRPLFSHLPPLRSWAPKILYISPLDSGQENPPCQVEAATVYPPIIYIPLRDISPSLLNPTKRMNLDQRNPPRPDRW